MKQVIEIKGYKVNISCCLDFKMNLEKIIGYIESFDIINESKYMEEFKKLKNDLNSFIDNNFMEEK